ncbi:MAG: serine hydrolase domain-containing protein [Sphingobium limneticum]
MRSIKLLAPLALMLMGGGAIAQQSARIVSSPVASATAEKRAAPLPAPAAVSGERAMTKQDVDTWLDGFMPFSLKKADVAGAVVVVVKDGQVLTQRGFGYADIAKHVPVNPDTTLFRPGSVSKLFTWTAVMQQVEAGKIDLDADVNNYIDFKIPLKDGKPVTMRQIMTHTAGFEEHGKETIFDDPQYLTSLGDYVKRSIPKRIYAGGSTPSYSNYATALAAYVVERVTKMSFDDYIEQRIFKPLGMTRSSFRQPLQKTLMPLMATGYAQASAEPSKYEFIGPAPAGSLASPGADMAKFMIAHLNQGQGLLKPETARMMHDTPLTLLPPLNRMELGFFETNINGRQVIGHLGDTQLFHTALHLFMNEKVGLYMSFNSTGEQAGVGPLRRALFEDFADRYFTDVSKPDGRVDDKTAAEHAKMLVGQWLNSRRAESNFYAIGNLLRQASVSVDAKGKLVVSAGRTANGKLMKWVEIAPFVWRNIDGHERLAAKVVDGKIVRWSIDGISPFMVFDRAPASQSSTWILPLLYASVGILLLTFLHWPVSALIRRNYKAPLGLQGRSLLAYRSVRLGAGLVVALLVAWFVTVSTLKGTPAFDARLWSLQIGGLIVFVGGVMLAGWNLWIATREKRGWFGKLWAVLILLATLLVLYTAWTFGLLSMTVNY